MRRVLSSCSLSLEAVKHGHTISAVGVEPCTGRLYFSGGGGGAGEGGWVGGWGRAVSFRRWLRGPMAGRGRGITLMWTVAYHGGRVGCGGCWGSKLP